MTGNLTFDYQGETYWLEHLGDDNPEGYGAFAVMCEGEEVAEIWTHAYGASPLVARVPLPPVHLLLRQAIEAIDEGN